jgi:holin-like protein
LKGFALILLFYWMGTFVHAVGVPVPGNVLGLVLLTAALFARVVKVEHVEEASKFLLAHMMLFFIPLLVGTVVFYRVLAEQFWPIAGSLVASTLTTLVATGWIVQTVRAKRRARG